MITHIFPKGHFALLMTKLFVKIIEASTGDSIVAALYHLNVGREKEKFIHENEQETAVKERSVVSAMQINTANADLRQYLKVE